MQSHIRDFIEKWINPNEDTVDIIEAELRAAIKADEKYISYPERDIKSPHITTDMKYHSFFVELTSLINRHSKDAESGTPDYVLAEYMISSLKTFCSTIENRMTHIYGSQRPKQ